MKLTFDLRTFTHRIDANGNIAYANESWFEFAAENGWSATAEDVLGRSLAHFIEGQETRHFTHILTERARNLEYALELNYRCDSPDCRRKLTMNVRYLPKLDQVEFSSKILELAPRKRFDLFSRSKSKCSEVVLNVCSWCKQVDVSGAWLEAEEVVQRLGLFETKCMPKITHGICPVCVDMLATIGGEV